MWSEADREIYTDDGRGYPSDLTDEGWTLIAPLLSGYDPRTAESLGRRAGWPDKGSSRRRMPGPRRGAFRSRRP